MPQFNTCPPDRPVPKAAENKPYFEVIGASNTQPVVIECDGATLSAAKAEGVAKASRNYLDFLESVGSGTETFEIQQRILSFKDRLIVVTWVQP